MYQRYTAEIEKIISKNMDKRGMDKISFKGEIQKAAASLLKSKTVMIVTGFTIKEKLVGETDGPIGAVSLAGALEQLGKKVVLVTDRYSEKILYNCCSIKGIRGPVEILPFENTDEFCMELLHKYRPSHTVAIERPGKARDGRFYSMRGEDISNLVTDTDILFEGAKKLGITTVAVGDGGNEVGMGKAAYYIMNYVDKGEKICSRFCSDYLIIAGVSNWGSHALAAALSLMANNNLMHGITTEVELMEGMIKAGAVDGCTRRSELTVDGLCLRDNLEIIDGLWNIVNTGLIEKSKNMLAI